MKVINYIIYGVLLSAIVALSITLFKERQSFKETITLNEKIIEEGRYTETYQNKQFDDLKKENKELYDSLKSYKNQIDYLVQFKYSKNYSTGIVSTASNSSNEEVITDTIFVAENTSIKAYEYSNEPNDSLNYHLTIGSTVEPKWYSLDLKVSDRFTLVNKESNGFNRIDITSDNMGMIDDVTLFNKKETNGFWDNFAFGPSVSVGYDINNHNVGVVVGISATYNLGKFFKKK